MNGIRKAFLSLAVLLLCLLGASAATAEARITFTPEKPRKGDYVDVTVTPEREGVQDVVWQLSTPEGAINIRDKNKKKDSRIHLTGTFRPREETEYTLTVTLVYGKRTRKPSAYRSRSPKKRRPRRARTWSTARRTAGGIR